MQLDYLTEADKEEYIGLFIFKQEISDAEWQTFWEKYNESDTSAIYSCKYKDNKSGKLFMIGAIELLVHNTLDKVGPVVYIMNIKVGPKYIGLGIEKQILKAVIDEALKYTPCEILSCCFEDLNDIFEECGFVKVHNMMEYLG